MPKVKIVSDPYRRTTKFFYMGTDWTEVCEENSPNSSLLAKKYSEGFFPFKAREIVDELLDEYGDGSDVLEIVFEGPDDEWDELQDVCSSEDLSSFVKLERSDRALANARDILPYIREVFDELYPIIAGTADGSPETLERLRKFRDASSDVIPICVVGNYSAGKSSFINALIGAELLPSGDRPVTARIFQIERSDQQDRASIGFKYADESVSVTFTDDGMKVNPAGARGRALDDIAAATADCDTGLAERVRAALGAINSFKEGKDEPTLSDLVKVRVPFGRSTNWGSGKKIVVFDTPGSNTNSNVDHVRVLREAMRGMSDGLPIYVTAYDALDSNDNAELYEQISQMPALDERFAMIVVNKADDADIPEGGFTKRDEEWVMDTVVARNLYAQGIYFVSSIAGLGAKTGGSFADRHYDRVFRRLRDGYEDPDDKYYTRLYDYDLLPEQLRAKAVREAESCDNRLLANSGLFSVEQGIDEFATKYSAYNKCYQSETLLHELIEQTDARLEESGVALESSRAVLSADLDESKNDLLDSLIQLSISTCEDAVEGYLPSMNEWAKQSIAATGLTSERLCDWERDITATKRRELGAEEKRRDAEGKKAAITANLMARVQNAWDAKDVLGISGIAKSFASDWSAAREAEAESEEIFRGADREASDDLLARVRDQFDSDIARLMQEAEGHSKAYWEERAEASRKALLDLVADGTAIDDNRREALRAIIVDFRSLSLDDELPEISEIRYPFDPNKLWKAPLRVQYNMELSQRVSKWRSVVEPAHEASFREWLHELTDALSLGAVDLNPELRRKFDSVVNTEREIEAQRSKRIRLHSGEKRVSGFMTWQEG
ncbi:dynamin family protein [Paratractidigestivibacter faecalis]|uniref:dynamin family protein n=1 Tax=Paratractidigestivibacter faecalis TaxID=2292441 RepID=UPI003F9D130E